MQAWLWRQGLWAYAARGVAASLRRVVPRLRASLLLAVAPCMHDADLAA